MSNTKGVVGEVMARRIMQEVLPNLNIRITARVSVFNAIFKPLKAFPDLADEANGVIRAIGEVKSMTKETFQAERQLNKLARQLENYNRKFADVPEKRLLSIQDNLDLLTSSKSNAAKRVNRALQAGGWIPQPIEEGYLEAITRTIWASGA